MKNINFHTLTFVLGAVLLIKTSGLYAQTYEEPIKKYPNGKVRSAWIKKGKKKKAVTVGLKIFYESGLIKREILSSDGQFFLGNKTSIRKEYYPGGALKAIGSAHNIVLTEYGNWKYYYENGTIESTGNYLRGVKVDHWQYYYSTGQLKKTGAYNIAYLKEGKGNLIKYAADKINEQGLIFLKAEINNVFFGQVRDASAHGMTSLGLIGIAQERGEWKYFDENGELVKTENF